MLKVRKKQTNKQILDISSLNDHCPAYVQKAARVLWKAEVVLGQE